MQFCNGTMIGMVPLACLCREPMKTDVFRARASNWAAAVSLAFAMSLGAVADARAEALADVLPDLLKTSKK